MTYVTEQTSAELRAHMRRLQAIPGWHNPLDDRLFKEIQALDAEIAALRSHPTALTAEEAGREGDAKDAAPHWATCESRGPWVRNSLKARIGDLRDGEKMCRRAYKKEFMGEPTKWYADALGEAAAVLERRLATLLPPAPAQSGGQG